MRKTALTPDRVVKRSPQRVELGSTPYENPRNLWPGVRTRADAEHGILREDPPVKVAQLMEGSMPARRRARRELPGGLQRPPPSRAIEREHS
jgi:hypothetical protein